jgi:hypothetical protein
MCRYPLDIYSAENGNMKELLHRGTQADLNIYVTTLNNGGIIGCGPALQHRLQTVQATVLAGLLCAPPAETTCRRAAVMWLAYTQRALHAHRLCGRCRVANNPWGSGAGYLPYDGVIIDTGTLPGSWYGGYNVGMNAVHEVGHW